MNSSVLMENQRPQISLKIHDKPTPTPPNWPEIGKQGVKNPVIPFITGRENIKRGKSDHRKINEQKMFDEKTEW